MPFQVPKRVRYCFDALDVPLAAFTATADEETRADAAYEKQNEMSPAFRLGSEVPVFILSGMAHGSPLVTCRAELASCPLA